MNTMLPINGWLVACVAVSYLALLFLIAYWAEITANKDNGLGRRILNSPLVYTLSIAVYCTSWTFFGAVGTAARSGLEFMAIYLGPSLVFFGWLFLIRKLARISRTYRITSIADFISSRYGKSQSIAALVTIVAVVASTPYIALQLKAVARSVDVLVGREPIIVDPIAITTQEATSGAFETAAIVALSIAAFTVLFGTRHLNANERHNGIVAAIAFESLVKLFAFAGVGFFVVFTLNHSPMELIEKMLAEKTLSGVYSLSPDQYTRWITLFVVSAIAAICLPRQFQVTVIENEQGNHLRSAAWMFPLYLFVLCLFVVPIAWTGLTTLPSNADPDLFVITIPLTQGNNWLALIAFIGGFSSATSMIIIASVVLALMVCNHLVVPILIRMGRLDSRRQGADYARALLMTRRASIVMVLFLGYLYLRLSEDTAALASIGLISFVGAAQFLPAILLGVFWRKANRAAAFWGILVGTSIWAYTLLLPAIERSGVPLGLLQQTGLLAPEALLGLADLDPLTHSLVVSLGINLAIIVIISSFASQNQLGDEQASLFVDIMDDDDRHTRPQLARVAPVAELRELSLRFLGRKKTFELFDEIKNKPHDQHPMNQPTLVESNKLVNSVETALSGSMGAASARVIVNQLARSEPISADEAMLILDEAQQLAEYSSRLEKQRQELALTAQQLVKANSRLTQMDRSKDEFLRQVSHELRTPLTSVRSFVSIMEKDKKLNESQRQRFLTIIKTETERLTRMLEGMLLKRRMDDVTPEHEFERLCPVRIFRQSLSLVEAAVIEHNIDIRTHSSLSEKAFDRFFVLGSPDALTQIFLNLLSNAIKFADSKRAIVINHSYIDGNHWVFEIRDNGPGFQNKDLNAEFQPINTSGRWIGAGIGLKLTKDLVDIHNGKLLLKNQNGAKVILKLPKEKSD